MMQQAVDSYDIVPGAGAFQGKRARANLNTATHLEGVENLTVYASDFDCLIVDPVGDAFALTLTDPFDRCPVLQHIKTYKGLRRINLIITPNENDGFFLCSGRRLFDAAAMVGQAVEANDCIEEFFASIKFTQNLQMLHLDGAAAFIRAAPSITRLLICTEATIGNLEAFGHHRHELRLVSAIASLSNLKALSLHFPWTSLYEKIMASISHPHECHNHLKALSIWLRSSTTMVTTLIAQYLVSPNASCLTAVQLVCCPKPGEMDVFFDALQQRATINSLTLSINPEDNQDATVAISKYLQNQSELKELYLDMNDTEFDAAFFSILHSHPFLEALTLRHTRGQPYDWSFLTSFLSSNNRLQSLNLFIGTIVGDFVTDLSEGLRMNNTLKRLHIQHGNNLFVSDRYALASSLDFTLLHSALADPSGESLCVLEHLGVGLLASVNNTGSLRQYHALLGSPHCRLQSLAIHVDKTDRSVQEWLVWLLHIIKDKPHVKHLELSSSYLIRPGVNPVRGAAPDVEHFTKHLVTIMPDLSHLQSLKYNAGDFHFLAPNTRKQMILDTFRSRLTCLETLQLPSLDDPVFRCALNQLCVRNKAVKAIRTPRKLISPDLLPMLLDGVKKAGMEGTYADDHGTACVAQVLNAFLRADPRILVESQTGFSCHDGPVHGEDGEDGDIFYGEVESEISAAS